MALQHLRSNTASKRPTAGAMSDGQIAVNTNATSPGLFFKDAAGTITKVGPVHVGTTAPNSSPAAGGSTGNSVGEQWLDTSGGGYVLKIWDGSAWRSEVGEFVDAAGDTMTGALILPSGTAAAPALGVGSTDNGIYSPGADQVAVATNGTGRLFVDALGRVGVGAASPGSLIELSGASSSCELRLRSTDTTNAIIRSYVNSLEAGKIAFTSGRELFIETAGYERLRIASDGKVGVGTSDPSQLLEVENSTGSVAINITSSDTGYAELYFGDQSDAAASALSYEHSSNKLRFYNGGSARVTLDSSGNLGIGTTSPDSRLHVVDSNSNGLRIGYTGNTNYYDAPTHIWRHPSGFAERMRIDSSGRVGVGTASPGTYNTNLAVYSAGGAFVGALHANSGTFPKVSAISLGSDAVSHTYTTNGSTVALTGSAHIAALQSASANAVTDLAFLNTAGGLVRERMRIDSSGRVGIGTSSPSQKLTSVGNIKIAGAQAGNVSNLIFTRTDKSWSINNETDLRFYVGTGDTDSPATAAVAFTSGGKVGIGTTTPSQKLQLSGLSSQYASIISTNSGNTGVLFGDATKVDEGFVLYANSDNSLRFGANGGTERARLDSSGRLLVGTSSARTNFFNAAVAPKFQIEGTSTSNDGPYAVVVDNSNTANGPRWVLGKSRSTGNTIVQSADRLGGLEYQGNDGSEFVSAANIECYVDGTPGANDMPGRLVFSTTASGSSSPTERLRITSNGYVRLASGSGGIQFNGDTAAANALDDYEEGTFTPVINGTTAVGSGTYSVQTGRYTKIGNRVCFTVRVAWSAHTGTGYMYIGGLPFQVNASEIVAGSVVADNLTVPAGSIMRALVINSSTSINLYSEATGGGSVSLVTLDTSGQIFVTGHYTV